MKEIRRSLSRKRRRGPYLAIPGVSTFIENNINKQLLTACKEEYKLFFSKFITQFINIMKSKTIIIIHYSILFVVMLRKADDNLRLLAMEGTARQQNRDLAPSWRRRLQSALLATPLRQDFFSPCCSAGCSCSRR